jgi:hypothetical protein
MLKELAKKEAFKLGEKTDYYQLLQMLEKKESSCIRIVVT